MLPDNTFLVILVILFIFTTFTQLVYYLLFYLAVPAYKHPDNDEKGISVSVIICARNEAENLKKFLPSVLEQKYPDYEVIVVNDCSEDNSDEILGVYKNRYPHLKISSVNKDPRFTHNKKFAQFIGIKAARNDILLFTDDDCHPVSDKWIQTITSHFDESTELVLGYGGYSKRRGLLNKYIRYDTFAIALQYLGMAVRGIPYMGVGRNLAYKRSLFFRKKGFGKFNHIMSGDDDLFVNTNSQRSNTKVEFRPESHVLSAPPPSLKSWFNQKKRHLSTAPYYKARDKILLITEPVSRFLFYISFILLLVLNNTIWQYVLIIFGLRLLVQVIIFSLGQRKLNESGILLFSVIFDIFSPVINGVIHTCNTFTRRGKHKWK